MELGPAFFIIPCNYAAPRGGRGPKRGDGGRAVRASRALDGSSYPGASLFKEGMRAAITRPGKLGAFTMRQRYNLERAMPVVIEVALEELRLIENLAKAVLEQEDMPDGVWKSELRNLLESVRGTIQEVASDAKHHFTGIADHQ